jgi:hypothetical protein
MEELRHPGVIETSTDVLSRLLAHDPDIETAKSSGQFRWTAIAPKPGAR